MFTGRRWPTRGCSAARWDGYLKFQRRPQPMLAWFARYI